MKKGVFAGMLLMLVTAAVASQQGNDPDYKHQTGKNTSKKTTSVHKHSHHIVVPFDHFSM